MDSSSSSEGPSDLQNALLEIARSKKTVEADHKTYNQRWQELNELKKSEQDLGEQRDAVLKKIKEVEHTYALLSSDQSLLEIKDKVAIESVQKVEKEVKDVWDKLSHIRAKTLAVSTRYVNECINFAMTQNCTEIGIENRKKAEVKESDDLKLRKHELGIELEKFLQRQKELEESEKEYEDLVKNFRGQEDQERNREIEAYETLREAEKANEDLEKERDGLDKELDNEANRLHLQLENANKSISYWERKVSENQRSSNGNNSLNLNNEANIYSYDINVNNGTSTAAGQRSGVSSLSETICSSEIRLPNGHTFSTANKTARISPQYVRPQPQKQKKNQNQHHQYQYPSKDTNINKPLVQSKLPLFMSNTNSNPKTSTSAPPPPDNQQKPKFFGPPPLYQPPKNISVPKPMTPTLQQFRNNNNNNGSFSSSTSSSQYFFGGSGALGAGNATGGNLMSRSYPSSSNGNNVMVQQVTTGSGRTFSFKVKRTSDGSVTLPGPTARSTSVVLGNTPFSTFQSSKNLLNNNQNGNGNQDQPMDSSEFENVPQPSYSSSAGPN